MIDPPSNGELERRDLAGSNRVRVMAWLGAGLVGVGISLLMGLLAIWLSMRPTPPDASYGGVPLGELVLCAIAACAIGAGFRVGTRGLRGARIDESRTVTVAMRWLGVCWAVLGALVVAVSIDPALSAEGRPVVRGVGILTWMLAVVVAAASWSRARRPVGAIASRALVLVGAALFPVGTVLAVLYVCSPHESLTGRSPAGGVRE